jgi:hypothetical protein
MLRAARYAVLCAILATFVIGTPANAEMVTISTFESATMTVANGQPFPANPSSLGAGANSVIERLHGAQVFWSSTVGKVEFETSAVLAGKNILSAQFQWEDTESSNTFPLVNPIVLSGFTGNGLFGEYDNWYSSGPAENFGNVADGQTDALNSIDVTSLLQSIVNVGGESIGFLFAPSNIQYYAYTSESAQASFSYSASNPQLVLQLEAVPEASSLFLMGSALVGSGLILRRRSWKKAT